MTIDEVRKPVVGYEGYYEVDVDGNVYGVKSGKMLKQHTTKKGYKAVDLFKNCKHKTLYVHRVVAMAFIPNVNEYPQVNHKDEDKTNNCANNLEWCSAKYNDNYGSRNARHSKTISGDNNKSLKPVMCVETGEIYKSRKEACELIGKKKNSLSSAINKTNKTCGGYHWVDFSDDWQMPKAEPPTSSKMEQVERNGDCETCKHYNTEVCGECFKSMGDSKYEPYKPTEWAGRDSASIPYTPKENK